MKKIGIMFLALAAVGASAFAQDSTPEMLKKKQFFDKPELYEAQSIFSDPAANRELLKDYEANPKLYTAKQLLPVAVCYITTGNYAAAEKTLEEYLKAEPKSVRALRMMGTVYFVNRKAGDDKGNEEKMAKAVSYYKKAMEMGDKAAAKSVASAYIISQTPDKISEVLPTIKELSKTDLEALTLVMVYAFRNAEQPDDALLKEVLSGLDTRTLLTGSTSEGLRTILRMYFARRDVWPDAMLVVPGRAAAFAEAWPLALELYKKALKADPKNALAMRGLSLVAYRTGDIQGAVDYIKQAIATGDKSAASDGIEIFLLTGDKSIWDEFKKYLPQIKVSMVVRVGMIQYAEARDSADVFFAACEGDGSEAIFAERRLDKIVFDGIKKFGSDPRAAAVKERWMKSGGSEESVAKIEAQIAEAQGKKPAVPAEATKTAPAGEAPAAKDDIGASLDKALKM